MWTTAGGAVAATREDEQLSARARLGESDWFLWREVALRGAGFPADGIEAVCDDELAAAADASLDGTPQTCERYDRVFADATTRLTAAVRATAAEPRFREAIVWQNPALVPTCLDRALAGERRNAKGRFHELAIVSYLQRYCLKNDTIGFFGPVGWARVEPQEHAVTVAPGPDLLARRTTYFERWPLDVLAARLAARTDVMPWLTPRISRSCTVSGSCVLLLGGTVRLSLAETRLLQRCDGTRTVRDLVGRPPDAGTLRCLLRLRKLGVLQIDLEYPVTRWPERGLRAQVERIADPTVRARVLEPLTELTSARDEVSRAAGDPERLLTATSRLAETFERLTGDPATRNSGGTYAARTLVYEDALRAVDVRLGRLVTQALAGPLALALDSATWLANTVAARCVDTCGRVLADLGAGSDDAGVPLLHVLAAAMPETLTPTLNPVSPLVEATVADFQRRWARVLAVPPGTRRHRVALEDVADQAAEEFRTGPPRWTGARRHAPDVMIAADGPDALSRDEFELVLGELHVATNTLESRLFLAQHPEPGRLRAAAEEDRLDDRVVSIPGRDVPVASVRLARPAELMLPHWTYVSVGTESSPVPQGAPVLPAGDLTVHRRGPRLVVRRSAGGSEHSFLEVVSDLLGLFLAGAFRPFAPAEHRPRVTVDRLVIGRESWLFPAGDLTRDLAWAFRRDERDRYAQARGWAARHGMPERGFVAVPVERKPMAVDFRSLPLVNLLAKSVRRTAEAGTGAVTLSEMLPDLDALWLPDARGRRYTSELRFVAVRG